MNDPNGLIEWNGQTHLFYQYNPHGPFHGTIHWGHAVSRDRVHWQDLPIALTPTAGGPDAEGCWSGCALDDRGTPTFLYTGVSPQTVCLATGSADLVAWDKPAANPVIDGPPAALRDRCGGDFRDPFVWQDDRGWNLILGCRSEGEGGLVLRYRSPDLRTWAFAGTLLAGDANSFEPVWTGTIWECPNFLDFGDRQTLIVSAQSPANELMYAFYQTGQLRGGTFSADPPRILVHGAEGEALYAPQTTRLPDGRYLLFGWLREGRSAERCMQAGWSGVMSLPMYVALQQDGSLALTPEPALQQLRERHWHFSDIELGDGTAAMLPDVSGDCLEIIATFEPGNAAECGLKLRCSPDGREYTHISMRGGEGCIIIERDHSSLDPECHRAPCEAPLIGAGGNGLTLHIFLDRSIIEVFADGGRTALAGRIYPTLAESLGVALFSRNGAATLHSLDIWTMKSIWSDPAAP